MGTVYDAEHLGLGRHVAIKVLSPAQAKKRVAVKRFQQEARAAGAIGHPNICEVYDMGLLENGSPYLVMEKLVGRTLADRIAREGGLPFEDVVEVMVQVLSGLIAAHEKGIVHRDIKPENIFLAQRPGCAPIAKILDFGVSKMMPSFAGGEDLELTRTGMVMGTPYYMSPEQARGQRDLDGRVDVYACGVMMYEAITGKRPFVAPNYNALLLSIINTTPTPIRQIRSSTPTPLENVVSRAMTKSRDERYPSAIAFLRDVQALATRRATTKMRVPPPPNTEERKRAQVGGGSKPTRSGARDTRPRASATLENGMSESRGSLSDQDTRVDARMQVLPRLGGSDSIEVSVESANATSGDYSDESPTEVFRPPGRQRASRPDESSTRAYPGFAPRFQQGEDQDPETLKQHPSRESKRAIRFAPEETVKIAGRELEIDVDFSDETKIAPPRRPR